MSSSALARDWYLLEVYRQRLDFTDLKKRVVHMMNRWRADYLVIELAATGKPLIRTLQLEHRMRAQIVPYVPTMEKVTRFETQVSRLDDTAHILPTQAPWLADFRKEILAFSNGKNDDMVDSMTQFLHWTGMRRGLSAANRIRSGGRRV